MSKQDVSPASRIHLRRPQQDTNVYSRCRPTVQKLETSYIEGVCRSLELRSLAHISWCGLLQQAAFLQSRDVSLPMELGDPLELQLI